MSSSTKDATPLQTLAYEDSVVPAVTGLSMDRPSVLRTQSSDGKREVHAEL